MQPPCPPIADALLDRIGVLDAAAMRNALLRGAPLKELPPELQPSCDVLDAIERNIVEPTVGTPLTLETRLALLDVLQAIGGDREPLRPQALFERLAQRDPGLGGRLRARGVIA